MLGHFSNGRFCEAPSDAARANENGGVNVPDHCFQIVSLGIGEAELCHELRSESEGLFVAIDARSTLEQ